jgi:hypothetical protein
MAEDGRNRRESVEGREGVEGGQKIQERQEHSSDDEIVEVQSPLMRLIAEHRRVQAARRRRGWTRVQIGARLAIQRWLGNMRMPPDVLYRVHTALTWDLELATMFLVLTRRERRGMVRIILSRGNELLDLGRERRRENMQGNGVNDYDNSLDGED